MADGGAGRTRRDHDNELPRPLGRGPLSALKAAIKRNITVREPSNVCPGHCSRGSIDGIYNSWNEDEHPPSYEEVVRQSNQGSIDTERRSCSFRSASTQTEPEVMRGPARPPPPVQPKANALEDWLIDLSEPVMQPSNTTLLKNEGPEIATASFNCTVTPQSVEEMRPSSQLAATSQLVPTSKPQLNTAGSLVPKPIIRPRSIPVVRPCLVPTARPRPVPTSRPALTPILGIYSDFTVATKQEPIVSPQPVPAPRRLKVQENIPVDDTVDTANHRTEQDRREQLTIPTRPPVAPKPALRTRLGCSKIEEPELFEEELPVKPVRDQGQPQTFPCLDGGESTKTELRRLGNLKTRSSHNHDGDALARQFSHQQEPTEEGLTNQTGSFQAKRPPPRPPPPRSLNPLPPTEEVMPQWEDLQEESRERNRFDLPPLPQQGHPLYEKYKDQLYPATPDVLHDKSDVGHGTVDGIWCVVRFAFDSEAENELSLQEGDKLRLLERTSAEWGRGELDGRQGIFPLAFVEEIESGSSQNAALTAAVSHILDDGQASLAETRIPGDVVYALYNFTGEFDNELSFQTGDEITVLEAVNDAWFRGSLGEKTGIFPQNFVCLKKN
uniref:SH3 domain-containing protein n=1 Tax=Eptatretus burgeri TaxID=7764 RepID=A0A8C4N4X2_EPTBU